MFNLTSLVVQCLPKLRKMLDLLPHQLSFYNLTWNFHIRYIYTFFSFSLFFVFNQRSLTLFLSLSGSSSSHSFFFDPKPKPPTLNHPGAAYPGDPHRRRPPRNKPSLSTTDHAGNTHPAPQITHTRVLGRIRAWRRTPRLTLRAAGLG
jgi:hypothetical protein